MKMTKRDLERDLLSPKYRMRTEKSRKEKLNEQKNKEAREAIQNYRKNPADKLA